MYHLSQYYGSTAFNDKHRMNISRAVLIIESKS